MGSGGSTSHQSYPVAPTASATSTLAAGLPDPLTPADFGEATPEHAGRVPRQPVAPNQLDIVAAGYDPDRQVLEAEFADGRLLGHENVSPQVWDDIRGGDVVTGYGRGTGAAAYVQYRCPECGQFVGGTAHACPGSAATPAPQPEPRSPDSAGAPTRQTTEAVLGDLAADHAASAAAQAAARAAAEDDTSTSYAQRMAAFQAAYDAARDRRARGEAAVPYMPEDATGGLGARDGGRGFGVEIEFDLPAGPGQEAALAAIGADLHAAGVTRSPDMHGYHASRGRQGYTDDPAGWRLERDSTVSGEIVSPILYDEPQTWANLATVCEVVRRHGGVATARTGGHVHVSAADYDHAVDNHHKLLEMTAEHEDSLYRLAQNPARPAHRGLYWCSPNPRPSQGYTSVEAIRNVNSSHSLAVNMGSVHGRASDHVEFRMWDGSLDPGVIQTQVKVSLGLTDAAFRHAGTPSYSSEPVGTHHTRNRTGGRGGTRLTGEAWRADTRSFRRLADTLFRRDADKAQATALFAVTRWQRGL